MNLEPYDAGFLGGDDDSPTCWWHEYIRSELAAAHDHYEAHIEGVLKELAAHTVQGEPVAWSGWGCQYPGKMPRLYGDRCIAELNCDRENGDQLLHFTAAPQPAEQQPEYGDAYQGARTDVAIWKRRALEAEQRVREQEQIIDRMGEDLNAINGPTFMGEPVLPKERPAPDVTQLVEALEEARDLVDSWSAYASDYFKEKHNLARDLERLDAVIAAHRKGGDE